MRAPRRFHVFLIGLAAAVAFAPLALAARPDARLGHWSRGTRVPVPVAEAYVGVAGSELFIIGGAGEGKISSGIVYRYNVRTKAWRRGPDLPRGVDHAGVTGYDGKVYVIGGFIAGNKNAIPDCFVFDPRSATWTAIASLPHARGSISVAVLGGRIHAVGGRDTVSVTEHDVYDPATNTWSTAAPLPPGEGRDHMGLLAFEGKLYAIGGRINDVARPTDFLESYDPQSDAWTELPRMPSKRSGGAAAVYHGRLFYIGGELLNWINNGTFITNEGYDPHTRSWSEFAPLPAGRHGFGAAVIDDRVYLPGGQVNAGGQIGWPNGYNLRKYSNEMFVFSIP